MDDFNTSSLHESKNEWSARLITILTPLIIQGLNSIFDESIKICKQNREHDKYLMTFQNFISRIPKWNPSMIEQEKKRICEKSGCKYLEELITCVHIIHLKQLTSIRVGNKQKKININVPKFNDFIHNAYIHVARKIYKNVYLFEVGISPLQKQKYNRELEIIVQECILTAIRESIPVQDILHAYMDENEEIVEEEVKEEIIEKMPLETTVNDVIKEDEQKQEQQEQKQQEQEPNVIESKILFNDKVMIQHIDGSEKSHDLDVPIQPRTTQYDSSDGEEDIEEDNIKIHISDNDIVLSSSDMEEIKDTNDWDDSMPELLEDLD